MRGFPKSTELLVIFGLLATVAAGEVLPGVAWRKPALELSMQPLPLLALPEAVGPAAMAPPQWAEMKEQKDAVWYQSGSAGKRAQDRSKEEKAQERRAWDMLQGMVIEEGGTREPSLTPLPSGGERKSVK
jgi:hypothetical protein